MGGRASSRKVSHSASTPDLSLARVLSRTVERKSMSASWTGVRTHSSPPVEEEEKVLVVDTGNPSSTPAESGIRPKIRKTCVTHLAAFRTTRVTGLRGSGVCVSFVVCDYGCCCCTWNPSK